MKATELYESYLEIKGAYLDGKNPLPMFRDHKKDTVVAQVGELRTEDRRGLGAHTGFRVLPYAMQDRYSRDKQILRLKTFVLENENLKATFLPDFGARLYSLFHKKENRELLFVNQVLQPANLAIRNAWFSGGIEWNISQLGHTFSTFSPMFSATCKDSTGNSFLRFYNYERCKEIFWHIDFHLPESSQTLHAYVKIINPKDTPESTYWWTNIALPEENGPRIFSEDSRVLYHSPQPSGFGQAEIPNLPNMAGKDASYPDQFMHSSEYFFQNDSQPFAPWEAAAYRNGNFFFERSSSLLRYRKMFCWGTHAGGQRWKDFLSLPGEGNYLEIQAGLAPTQMHGIEIPAHTTWDFVQVFGGGHVDHFSPFHDEDWQKSSGCMKNTIDCIISESDIQTYYEEYQISGRQLPGDLVHCGEGWGVLEYKRNRLFYDSASLHSMVFPDSTLAEEQKEWLHLLEKGFLPVPKNEFDCGFTWLVSAPWLNLLEKSVEEEGNHWYAHLHLGIMYYENGLYNRALEEWKISLHQKINPLAYRNLGYHEWKYGNLAEAEDYYKRLFEIEIWKLDRAYIEEYLQILLAQKKHKEMWEFYQSNLGYVSYWVGKSTISLGFAALELGETGYVDALFQKEFPQMKEGENSLTDLWFLVQARKLAQERGIPLTDREQENLRKELQPPAEIDFRMQTAEITR